MTGGSQKKSRRSSTNWALVRTRLEFIRVIKHTKDDLLSVSFPFSNAEGLYEVMTGGAAGLDLLQNMVGRR